MDVNHARRVRSGLKSCQAQGAGRQSAACEMQISVSSHFARYICLRKLPSRGSGYGAAMAGIRESPQKAV